MKNIKEFKPLIKFISKEKKKIIIATIIIFLNGICDICVGYLNGAAIEAITNLDIRLSLIYLGIYFISSLAMGDTIYRYGLSILYKVEAKITQKLGFNAYTKALELPAVAYEKHTSGEIINRITNDTDSLSFTFSRLLNIATSVLGTILIMFYIIYNSWIIALEIMLIMFILYLVVSYYNPKIKSINEAKKKEHDNFTSLTTETIRGIREIKTLGIKTSLINNAKDIVESIYKKSETEIDLERHYNMTIAILKSILEIGVFVTCVILLYHNMITLTFFIAMTYYIYRYTWLFENLSELTKTYQKLSVSIGRVNDIIENRLYEDEKYGNIKLNDCEGKIEFKNVTFNYPEEKVTLKNFNLKLEPNRKIAIVGASGSGKSTLFNLITRIFDIEKGQILIDGIDIKELTEDSLRKNISIIRQEPFIFHRTIEENFKLLNPNIKLNEIRKYTKMAYLDDYIMKLPSKYKTLLGEGGVNLSGGQKQRLSIARTLAKNSKIILFDEATSALDNESQEYIKKSIDELVKDHTIIIIAHRLSTIVDADIINVVDNGKVVASGSHNELMKTCDIYKKLYQNETIN